jgi:hypothetical protein
LRILSLFLFNYRVFLYKMMKQLNISNKQEFDKAAIKRVLVKQLLLVKREAR